MLIRVKKLATSYVRRTLAWIAYASPRLKIPQLLDVLSLDDVSDTLDIEDRPDVEAILHSCSSLVRIAGDYIELAHFSVLE